MNLKLVQLSEELKNDNESYEYENKVLLETLKEQKKELNKKQSQLEKLEDMQIKVRKLRSKNSILKNRLLYKQKEITSLKKENYVKRVKMQYKKMKSLSDARKKQVEKIKTKFRTVKKIKKNYKVLLTLAESNIENIKMENKKIMNRFYSKVNYWKQEAQRKKQTWNRVLSEKEDLKQELIARQREDIEIQENNELRTKENNRYTDDMGMCVMDLQSLDISNNKIGDVIKSVGTNIFKQQLKIPSKTTIQNIADEAPVLSKYHVAERLKESDNFGLFSDGTSREGRKIMDIGVHLEDATMSLGYKVIATDDAETVSELLKSSIREFGEIPEMGDHHNDININTNGLLKKTYHSYV